jgi:hypothetical protein
MKLCALRLMTAGNGGQGGGSLACQLTTAAGRGGVITSLFGNNYWITYLLLYQIDGEECNPHSTELEFNRLRHSLSLS